MVVGIAHLDNDVFRVKLIRQTGQLELDPRILVHLLESEPERFRLDRQQRLRISEALEEPEERFRFITELMTRLAANIAGSPEL